MKQVDNIYGKATIMDIKAYNYGHEQDGGQVVEEGPVVERVGGLQNDPGNEHIVQGQVP